MNVIDVCIGDIKPYGNNPRKNANAVSAVCDSIAKYGFQQPIVVDVDMVIIAGHTRYLAAKKMGADTVPVVVAENLSPQLAAEYRLADNGTSEISEWDMDKLRKELDLISIDMSKFGVPVLCEHETAADPEEENIKPYKRVHFLVSIHPDHIDEIANQINSIKGAEHAEVIQGAN